MSVANQIFRCAQQAQSGALLGVLLTDAQPCRFMPANNAKQQQAEHLLPVYMRQPGDVTSSCFLVVETATQGVLEIRAYQRQAQQWIPVQIVT